jgi:putative PIN family toxin of toxin-antitoxin system
MKYYAVIDTNVLVSAMLKWNSVPGNIMELVFGGQITPVFNEKIIEEYQNVLSRSKFHFTEKIVRTVVDQIVASGICIDSPNVSIQLPDPKDIVFYAVVMEQRKSKDTYLVTGNMKHFPTEPFIVTPRQLLDIIEGRQSPPT